MNLTRWLVAVRRGGCLVALIPALAWACTPQGGGATLLSPAPNETGVPTNVLIILVEVLGGFVPRLELVTDGGTAPVPLTEAWRRGGTVALRPTVPLPVGSVARLPGVYGAPPALFDATFSVGSGMDTTPPLAPASPIGVPYNEGLCWGERVSFTPRQPTDDQVTYELATDAGVVVAAAVNHFEVACSTAGVALARRSRGDVVLTPSVGSLSLRAIDRAGQRGPATEFSVAESCAGFDAGVEDGGDLTEQPDAGNSEARPTPAGGCSTTPVGFPLAWALLALLRRLRGAWA